MLSETTDHHFPAEGQARVTTARRAARIRSRWARVRAAISNYTNHLFDTPLDDGFAYRSWAPDPA